MSVLLTGGMRGIGKSILERLIAEDKKIVTTYCSEIDANYLDDLDADLSSLPENVEALDINFLKPDNVKKLIDKIKQRTLPFTEFVSNAGICDFENYLKISDKSLDKTFNINFKAPFLISQAICSTLIKHKMPGSLCFVSSISADIAGEYQSHYCATKGALDQLMRCIAYSMGKYGIRSNSVQPGTVLTDINFADFQTHPQKLEDFIARTPIKRLATGEDVANAVHYLISGQSSGITGITLRVDGGFMAGIQ